MAAQRYPEDSDGIIAGAPANVGMFRYVAHEDPARKRASLTRYSSVLAKMGPKQEDRLRLCSPRRTSRWSTLAISSAGMSYCSAISRALDSHYLSS
jgi:hypothetical protein